MNRAMLFIGVFLALCLTLGWTMDYSPDGLINYQHIEVVGGHDESRLKSIRDRLATVRDRPDLVEVKQAVEDLGWVSRANVRWIWPDRLELHIEERRPVAIWNDRRYLDNDGAVFDSEFLDYDGLPLLYGPEETEKLVMWQYQQLSRILLTIHWNIERINLDETGAWSFRVGDGIEVALGKSDTFERIQRLVSVWPALQADSRRIGSIDLRYTNGIAVNWDSCDPPCGEIAQHQK